ncbi:MAG: SIMPL domain-containing protein, partial [Bacteroidota bacterium]
MKTLACLAFFATMFSSSLAQVMGNYANQQQTYSNVQFNAQYRALPKAASILGENVLQITINALSNQKAYSYTALFNIVQVGKTVEETESLMNSRLSQFLADLKGMGIPDTNVYVDMVNFLPKYEQEVSKKLFSKKTYTEVPKGFELQKNVHIRYSKPALLDKIVAAASRQEIYDIVKVDYFVKNQEKVYQQLRAATLDYLKTVTKHHESLGLALDSAYVISGENAWVAYPINRYESYQAFYSQNVDAAEKNAVVNVAEKPVSR